MGNSLYWIFTAPLALTGLGLLAAAVIDVGQKVWLIAFGGRAVGRIVDFVKAKQPRQKPQTAMDLAPPGSFLRIGFTDERGRAHTVVTKTSVSPKKYRKGDDVPLLYSHRPSKDVRRQAIRDDVG